MTLPLTQARSLCTIEINEEQNHLSIFSLVQVVSTTYLSLKESS
ncbi:mCG141209 [Mus musculus]|nr:mCG141209 [Mus musculus]